MPSTLCYVHTGDKGTLFQMNSETPNAGITPRLLADKMRALESLYAGVAVMEADVTAYGGSIATAKAAATALMETTSGGTATTTSSSTVTSGGTATTSNTTTTPTTSSGTTSSVAA